MPVYPGALTGQFGEKPPVDRDHPLLAALADHPNSAQPHVHIGQQCDRTSPARNPPSNITSAIADPGRCAGRRQTPRPRSRPATLATVVAPAPAAHHHAVGRGRGGPAVRDAPAPRSTARRRYRIVRADSIQHRVLALPAQCSDPSVHRRRCRAPVVPQRHDRPRSIHTGRPPAPSAASPDSRIPRSASTPPAKTPLSAGPAKTNRS